MVPLCRKGRCKVQNLANWKKSEYEYDHAGTVSFFILWIRPYIVLKRLIGSNFFFVNEVIEACWNSGRWSSISDLEWWQCRDDHMCIITHTFYNSGCLSAASLLQWSKTWPLLLLLVCSFFSVKVGILMSKLSLHVNPFISRGHTLTLHRLIIKE